MKLENNLKKYVAVLAEKAQEEAAIFPIDREFLEQYLSEIMSYDLLGFIYYNFEMTNDTYVNQLFVCLPEVWENITVDNIIEISENFTNIHSYFTLIRFTYKYIEIDIIELILDGAQKKNPLYLNQIVEYLKNQWNVLIKSKSDLEDFANGFVNIDYNRWKYIKQKFLIDKRVKPALLDFHEMKSYIVRFVNKIAN